LGRLGAAVIGLGVGRRHLRAYRQLEGVEVRAVCAESAESVDGARAEHGVPDGSTDYREVIDRPDVQLVSICSPDGRHAEQALFALRCGKHVLVEKPVAVTMDEARALVDAVRSSGLTFASGQSYRFIPQFQALRAAAAAGRLGGLYLLQGRYEQDLTSMAERGPDYWRVRDPQDFLLGAGIHLVDFLRWAGGEVVEVAAYASHALAFYPGSENWVLGVRFASGAAGQAVVAVGSRRKVKFGVDFALHGSEGCGRAAIPGSEWTLDLGAGSGDGPERIAVTPVDAVGCVVEDFVAGVRARRPPAADVSDGARAVAICVAGIESSRSGRPVPVPRVG
jgi:UDP-N-acetyl-2-amino-2-deoxyglucuronate dehydrogenase